METEKIYIYTKNLYETNSQRENINNNYDNNNSLNSIAFENRKQK